MSDPKGSWSKKYDEVDSDVPFFQSPHYEGEATPQSPKIFSTSTTPEPLSSDPSSFLPTIPRPARQHTSYIHGPLTHEASSSNLPPTAINSTSMTTPLDLSNGAFNPRSQRTTVSSVKSFASSPLNPSGSTSFSPSPFNRSVSRGSAHINRIASEECRAFASHQSTNHSGSRGSMILYRCADPIEDGLLPPTRSHLNRNSILSISGDSIVSLSSDSKYPARTIGSERGLIAYAYDPSLEELGSATPADDDYLHDPDEKFPQQPGLFSAISSRGVFNVLALVALIAAILCLFVVYPVIRFYHDNGRNLLITFNARINATGQADDEVIVQRRSQIFLAAPIPLIDPSTPFPARILKTAQDIIYELVFSDEFTQDGRSFGADQDLIWEAVSSSTGDGYDPSQMNTHHGNLRVCLQAQDRKRQRCRYDKDGFTTGTQVAGTGSSRGSWREEERVREKERGEMYRDTSSSGILKMKVPVRLSHGGFVEVGLREEKRVGRHSCSGSRIGEGVEEEEEEEGTLRRLLYWSGSSNSWFSHHQSDILNIPVDILSTLMSDSDVDYGTSLTLSIGERRRSRSSSRRGMEVEVDYVRIYQPMTSLVITGAEARRQPAVVAAAAARDEYAVLDLVEI